MRKKSVVMWTSPAEKRGEKKAAGFCRNERQRALPGSASTLSASTISQSRSFVRPRVGKISIGAPQCILETP